MYYSIGGDETSEEKSKRMKQLVVNELISTEEVYLTHLFTLMHLFIEPIKQDQVKVSVFFRYMIFSLLSICSIKTVCIHGESNHFLEFVIFSTPHNGYFKNHCVCINPLC